MIQGEKVQLRALEPTDLPALYDWENNPEVWRMSHTANPFSMHTLKRYVESVQDIFADRQLRLMIELKDPRKLLGCIDLFDFDPLHLRAGIGIMIADPSNRSQGYGSDALQQLITYSFGHLGLHQVYCNVLHSNTLSLKLFEKHGFSIIATKRDWVRNGSGFEDELLLQLINPGA